MSDPAKEQEMGINTRLIHQKPPVIEYNTRLPTWKEMQEVVRAIRSASAPGPSGVPYIVYKRCKEILQILWKILRVIWRRGKIVEQWRFAEGVWISKEEGSKSLDQFRIISLLNTESKIFFGLSSRRLSDFILGNGYIDTPEGRDRRYAKVPWTYRSPDTAPERGKGKQRGLDCIMVGSR